MKRLLLASAVLGFAGAIGTANAVPLTATALGIWSGDTPSPNNISTAPVQQALPATRALLPLITASPAGAASGPISLLDPFGTGTNTVGAFLASGPIVSAGCGLTCQGTNLSGANGLFTHASLFEFQFTIAAGGSLTITHDDGASLFADGGGGNTPVGADLLPVGASAPTFAQTQTISIGPGVYDLFYESNNGLPEQLTTNFVVAAPEPASLTLLGSALLGLGWLGRRRRKTA